MRGWRTVVLVSAVFGSSVLACSGPPALTTLGESPPLTRSQASVTKVAIPSPPTPIALLPRASAPLSPAQTEVAGVLTGETLADTETCAGCHPDAAAQWRSSAHSFASFNNPIYRVAVDRFRADVGAEPSRFCGGCHDPALLVDGAMSRDVTPSDARAHAGITCRVCHGVETARSDGNGSYVLATSPIPPPRDGDPESLRLHRARVAMSPLRTAALCGSCHRSFLSVETGNHATLVGQDELGEWQRSPYAGSLAARVDEPLNEAKCQTCHMPLEAAPGGDVAAKGGKIRSHRFAGGSTWIAAIRGDAPQLEAAQAMLHGAASIDVAVAVGADGTRTLPADGAPVTVGKALTLDVVVRNERVGHRFPGGVLDAQDTWIELAVRDARGALLAEAGAAHEASGEDPTAHRLRALQGGEGGTPLLLRETHRFRAPVFNHTIAPRDADVVRFRFDVPARLDRAQLPLRVTARLRHRSRDRALALAVCADASTTRGAAFTRETAARAGRAIDPCVAEPVTEVATSEVELGEGARSPGSSLQVTRQGSSMAWRRLYDHGLGMLHALQEDVDSARPSLERALESVPAGSPRDRAIVLDAMAEMSIREGRTDEALRTLDEVATLAPDHPAIAHRRGAALAGIWRWAEATVPLREAALAAPLDDLLWSHLAVAYGSAGAPQEALDAAAHGLALSPRDADMLRVQALALEKLGAAPDDVARARDAFARWRLPDDAPAIKNGCSRRFPWCALERIPVHVHRLRPAPLTRRIRVPI